MTRPINLSLYPHEVNHLLEALYPYISSRRDYKPRLEATKLKNKLLNKMYLKEKKQHASAKAA